jgi:iron complex transport system substrate-binding protein
VYRRRGAAARLSRVLTERGLTPCFAGHSAGEAAELLGAVIVAGSLDAAPRRLLTVAEIRDLAPDVIVAASSAAAAAIRADSACQGVSAVVAGRVAAPPTGPFGWGPRPPSVNRLAGLVWMAYALPARAFDDAYYEDVRSLFAAFYHATPSAAQLRALTHESH